MTFIMTINDFNLHLHQVINYWVANHDLRNIKICLILFQRFKRFKYLSPSSKSLFPPHCPGRRLWLEIAGLGLGVAGDRLLVLR